MTPAADKPSPWPAFVCVAFGIFMATLDSSIVNVALPSILADFQVPLATVEWVVNVYLLVITGLLLAFGRLADLWGQRAVYLAGLAAFTASSLLCSLSSSPWQLVAARAVQGLGGAMLMACAPAIITAVFRPEERGRGLGFLGTVVALGLTAGPPLGGLLLGIGGWRTIFVVNLPVGLLAMACTLWLLPPLKFARRRETFDLAGAALFTLGCGAVVLFLNALQQPGSSPARIWAAAGAAVACLVAFLVRESRVQDPLLDLRLFANREFSAALGAAVLAFLSGLVVVLLVPFYLTQVRGLTPKAMGLALTVTPLLMTVLAPWAGSLSDRLGPRKLTTAGLVVRALGLALLLLVKPASPLGFVILGLALLGLGNALFTSPNTSAIMGAVPPERLGVAGGVGATARNLGMLLGIALGGATFSTVYRRFGGTSLAAYTAAQADAFTAGWQAAMGMGLGACLLALWVSSTRSGSSAVGEGFPVRPADEKPAG